jgi:putative transposase
MMPGKKRQRRRCAEIKGKKRHILVDMQGLLLHAIVHSAGVQDRDGGIWLLATLFGQFPFLAKLFADSAYAGPIFNTALAEVLPNVKTEIVKRSDRAKGFVPLPKRWIVERTIAWLNRCRRLAKDWENLNRNALAFLKLQTAFAFMAISTSHRVPSCEDASSANAMPVRSRCWG